MNTTLSPAMDETLRYLYVEIIERYTLEYVKAFEFEYKPWVFSVLGSIILGLSGIFPLLVIPVDAGGTEFSDRKCAPINLPFFYPSTYFILSITNLHIYMTLFHLQTIFHKLNTLTNAVVSLIRFDPIFFSFLIFIRPFLI